MLASGVFVEIDGIDYKKTFKIQNKLTNSFNYYNNVIGKKDITVYLVEVIVLSGYLFIFYSILI